MSSAAARPLELKFRLDEVPAEGRRFAGALPVSALESDLPGLVGDLGYRPTGPARVEGTVYRSAKSELVVDGRLEAEAGFDCVRCLTGRTLEVRIREDHVLVRREKADPDAEGLTLSEDDLEEPDVESFAGDEVDLTDLFRQDLLLALPMNPTCESVGQADACHPPAAKTTPQDEVDPRWAPLLELKKKLT